MDGFGFFILFAAAAVIFWIARRHRAGRPIISKGWISVPRQDPRPTTDFAEVIACKALEMARPGGTFLIIPLCVHLSVLLEDKDFVLEAAQGIHDSAVVKINARGPAAARRRGTAFQPISALDLSSGVVIGSVGVIMSFRPQENPFLSMNRELPTQAGSQSSTGPRVTVRVATGTAFDGAATVPMDPPTIPPTSPPPTGKIYVVEAALDGKSIAEVELIETGTPVEISIGRAASNTLVVPTMGGISSRHATLRLVGDDLWLTDESTYGIWFKAAHWAKSTSGERVKINPLPSSFALDKRRRLVVSVRLVAEESE